MGLEAVSLPVFLKTCSDGPSHSLFYDGSHHPCEIKYLSLMMICLAGIMCLLVTSSVWKWTTGHALALEPYEKSKVYMCCYCYTGIQSYRRPLKSYPPSFLFTLFWDSNMSTLYHLIDLRYQHVNLVPSHWFERPTCQHCTAAGRRTYI